jgi:hypothetical protein
LGRGDVFLPGDSPVPLKPDFPKIKFWEPRPTGLEELLLLQLKREKGHPRTQQIESVSRLTKSCQTSTAKGQESNIWFVVSSLALQRGHMEGPSQLVFLRFSIVRMLLWANVQIKMSTLGSDL